MTSIAGSWLSLAHRQEQEQWQAQTGKDLLVIDHFSLALLQGLPYPYREMTYGFALLSTVIFIPCFGLNVTTGFMATG